jgi:Na+/H+-dicarboxylate symporter
MNVIKNYTSTILLLLGILIGGVCGMIFGEDAAVVKPVGDIFMNFMYVLVVPIVCLSVSSAMCTMKRSNMAGRVLVNTLLVFLVMSVVLAVLSWLCILVYNPMTGVDSSAIQLNGAAELPDSGLSVGEMLVSTVSVPEFLQMFEKPHLLPLIIFSVVFGLATAVCGEKGKPVADFLESGSNVVLKMMDYLMYLAPVCLGCYFAATIGSLGGQIVNGYLGAFVLYLVLTVIVYFGVNSVYIFLAGGKNLLKLYWRNILPPSLTAVGTSSSAACIPFNIEAAQNMGVPSSIASTVVPFGTNIHKDGSVVSSVVKIVFLMTIFGGLHGLELNGFVIVFTALISSLVVGAIPSGGMTGELLICSILGYSPELAVALMVISTIIDEPATMLNATGNVVASVLVARISKKQVSDEN